MQFNLLYMACDHAGFKLKEQLRPALETSLKVHDLGPFNDNKCDYPDSAQQLLQALQQHSSAAGLLICGSGQGMAMAANRKAFARAALCWNVDIASLARQHNNANILCLGARYLNSTEATKIIEVFLATPFEGGRHANRINKF